MKEYVRRVKATVELSWMDDGEGEEGAEEKQTQSATAAVAA